MSKVAVITTAREQQQRFLMNMAKIAVATRGRQFEARRDQLSLLMSINPLDLSLEESGVVIGFCDAVSVLVSYYSDINKRVMSQEDVSSKRFVLYQQSLAKCGLFMFDVDKLIIKLAKGTDLPSKTIPSHYFNYVRDEETKKPEEIQEAPYPDYLGEQEFEEEEGEEQ